MKARSGTEVAHTEAGDAVEFKLEPRMQGGMKHVYFTADGAAVVAFFLKKDQDPGRRERLRQVIEDFNPTRPDQQHADYWRTLFCWPTDLVEHPTFGLGLRLPKYPSQFFFTKGARAGQEKDGGWFNCNDRSTGRVQRYSHVEPEERGDLGGYLAAMIRVSRAVARLHRAGLAHADLSDRNVLIDPTSGAAILIDLDSLVVTGQYPPDVLGTMDYIAPEVMATKHLALTDPNRKHPSAETDRHALAVMIYRYLLERHPLEGQRVLQGLSAEDEDEALRGAKAVYSEHRSDPSNRPRGNFVLRAEVLGRKVADLFHTAFVDGLARPDQRPLPGVWEAALCEAFDALLRCADAACTHKWFVLTDPARPVCPYCGSRYGATFHVLKLTHQSARDTQPRDEGQLVLNAYVGGEGTSVYAFHTHRQAPRGPGQDPAPKLQVMPLDPSDGRHYLKNKGLPELCVRSGPDKPWTAVGVGRSFELKAGLELRFGPEPTARTATVTRHGPG
jgi:hypothetical protein